MRTILVILSVLALTACAPAVPTPNPVTPTAPPTVMPTATSSPLPPTAVPTPTDVSSQLAEGLYVNDMYGYSLAVPAGWQVLPMEDVIIMVADAAAVSNNTPTPALTVSSGPLETFLGGMLLGVPPENAGAVLQVVIPQLLGETFLPGEFETFTVGGHPAISAPLTGQDETGIPVAGFVTLVLSDQRAAILLGTAPSDQWSAFEPLYRGLVETFTFIDS